MNKADFGVIGGSGFYNMDSISDPQTVQIETPFGSPSEKIILGKIKDQSVAFLARHGMGHRLNPSEINYRANLYAMKLLGVQQLISVTAVGSLKEELKPRDLVIPDQIYDNSFKRDKTFFEDGIAIHVSMADPTCKNLSKQVYEIASALDLDVHLGGTYFNMEGPQFSTKAESETYRKLGFSVIGMTLAVEAKLARELELCFVPLAFVTDYDCWHEETEPVTVEMIVRNLKLNSENARAIVTDFIGSQGNRHSQCDCSNALQNNIITDPAMIPPATLSKLEPIIGKYIKNHQK